MERLLPCLLRASPSSNSHLRYISSDCRILSIKILASQLENADDKEHSVQVALAGMYTNIRSMSYNDDITLQIID
jgi:hypothetical protein